MRWPGYLQAKSTVYSPSILPMRPKVSSDSLTEKSEWPYINKVLTRWIWTAQTACSAPAIYQSPSIYPQKGTTMVIYAWNSWLTPEHVPSLPWPTQDASCLVVIDTIRRLGLSWEHLITGTMKMHAANSQGINTLGAVIFRFSGKSIDGQALETCQTTYITDNSDKLFLIREPCIGLGMISRSFPCIGKLTFSAITI